MASPAQQPRSPFARPRSGLTRLFSRCFGRPEALLAFHGGTLPLTIPVCFTTIIACAIPLRMLWPAQGLTPLTFALLALIQSAFVCLLLAINRPARAHKRQRQQERIASVVVGKLSLYTPLPIERCAMKGQALEAQHLCQTLPYSEYCSMTDIAADLIKRSDQLGSEQRKALDQNLDHPKDDPALLLKGRAVESRLIAQRIIDGALTSQAEVIACVRQRAQQLPQVRRCRQWLLDAYSDVELEHTLIYNSTQFGKWWPSNLWPSQPNHIVARTLQPFKYTPTAKAAPELAYAYIPTLTGRAERQP